MLSVEEMQQIMVEELTGNQPTIQGPEADQFRASVKQEAAEAAKQAIMLTIPNEWPDMGQSGDQQNQNVPPSPSPRSQAAEERFRNPR